MSAVATQPQTVLDVLIGARALIAEEKNWTKGAWARTADGRTTTAASPEAYSFCLSGAIQVFARGGILHGAALTAISRVAKPDGPFPGPWNDGHSHADVLAALDATIAAERATTATAAA